MRKERLRESVRLAIDNLLFEACGCGGSPEPSMEEVPLEAIPWVLSDEDPAEIEASEGEPRIERAEAVEILLQMAAMVSCPMTAQSLTSAADEIMNLDGSEQGNYDEAMLSGDEQFMDDHMGEIRDEDLLSALISPSAGSCG